MCSFSVFFSLSFSFLLSFLPPQGRPSELPLTCLLPFLPRSQACPCSRLHILSYLHAVSRHFVHLGCLFCMSSVLCVGLHGLGIFPQGALWAEFESTLSSCSPCGL